MFGCSSSSSSSSSVVVVFVLMFYVSVFFGLFYVSFVFWFVFLLFLFCFLFGFQTVKNTVSLQLQCFVLCWLRGVFFSVMFLLLFFLVLFASILNNDFVLFYVSVIGVAFKITRLGGFLVCIFWSGIFFVLFWMSVFCFHLFLFSSFQTKRQEKKGHGKTPQNKDAENHPNFCSVSTVVFANSVPNFLGVGLPFASTLLQN